MRVHLLRWMHRISKLFAGEVEQEFPFILSNLLNGINDDNLHNEVNTGSTTGKEVW